MCIGNLQKQEKPGMMPHSSEHCMANTVLSVNVRLLAHRTVVYYVCAVLTCFVGHRKEEMVKVKVLSTKIRCAMGFTKEGLQTIQRPFSDGSQPGTHYPIYKHSVPVRWGSRQHGSSTHLRTCPANLRSSKKTNRKAPKGSEALRTQGTVQR